MEPSPRVIATLWADKILRNHPQVKRDDVPTIRATLIEAALFELPVKQLAVAINAYDSHYKITIKGYTVIMSDRRWAKLFFTDTKAEELESVSDTFTQLTETGGAIKVIHVDVHQASDATAAAPETLSARKYRARERIAKRPIGAISDEPEITIEARDNATTWAHTIMAAHPKIKVQDKPYMEALLIELGLFEQPIEELSVGIHPHEGAYRVIVKGYKSLMNDRRWANIFLADTKSEQLDNVKDTFTQRTETGGAIKVIHMDSVNFTSAQNTNDAPTFSKSVMHSRKKRATIN